MKTRNKITLCTTFLTLAIGFGITSQRAAASDRAQLGDDKLECAGEDCCADYYDCIDACAEADAKAVDHCNDEFKDGSDAHKGCMSLANELYESCLEECGPAPDGC